RVVVRGAALAVGEEDPALPVSGDDVSVVRARAADRVVVAVLVEQDPVAVLGADPTDVDADVVAGDRVPVAEVEVDARPVPIGNDETADRASVAGDVESDAVA